MNDVERLTQAFGRELFARLDTHGPVTLSPRWWDDRLMEWTMSDQAVKLQLFRFIDVLPLLRGPNEIVRHLREYFQEAAQHLPGFVRWGLRGSDTNPKRKRGAFLACALGWCARLLAFLAQNNAERLARRFIAGSNLEEALLTVAKLRKRRLTFTVDLLGEATVTEAEAQRNEETYLHILEGLSGEVNVWPAVDLVDRDHLGPLPRVNVSIKLSSLYSQFDPLDRSGTTSAVCVGSGPSWPPRSTGPSSTSTWSNSPSRTRRCRLSLHPSRNRSSAIGPTQASPFKRIFTKATATWPSWPTGLGGGVRRSGFGSSREPTGITKRVLAAQEGWPVPVFDHKWQTDDNYERLTLFLLENRDALRPALGSHNVRSLAHALAAAHVLGSAAGKFRVPDALRHGRADSKRPCRSQTAVRIYTPYGQLLPGMAYLVRRLLENTANESFLRASFTDRLPEEVLLMKPGTWNREQGIGNREQGSQGSQAALFPVPCSLSPAFLNSPLCDFSQEVNVQVMQTALADVKKRLGKDYPPVIAGQSLATAEFIESLNPSHKRKVVAAAASRLRNRRSRPSLRRSRLSLNGVRPARPNGPSISRGAAEVMRRRLRVGRLASVRVCQELARGRRRRG